MTRHRPGPIPGLRLLALVLLGALAGSALAPGSAVAAGTSNIPGIPLPGPTVTGDLGGSIYDVVYRVTVPAGNVLLVSMTGDQGTDFDLYVFDSTASDVYANPPVGLVGKSTGPSSSESVSLPSATGGTYYIDLAGFSTTMGTYLLTVRIAPDTTAPSAIVILSGGAPATNDPVIAATIQATDDLSGVESMALSLDGTTWTSWAPYASVVLWTFAPPDGTKDFYARVRDRAGNVSAVAHDQIQLDTLPPTIVSASPGDGSRLAGLRPVISVRFSEPIQASSWVVGGLTLRDAFGTAIYGALGFDAAATTGTYMPASDLTPGEPYRAELGDVRDIAGNRVVATVPWTIVPLTPSVVSLTASASLAARGAGVTLDGRLASISGAAISLEQSVGDGPFREVVPLLTAEGGAFRTVQPVMANTRFRAVYAGSGTVAPGTSPAVRVLVRRTVTLAGRSAGVTSVATHGRSISLKALVGPAGPAIAVTFRIYRTDPATGRLVLKTTVARTTVNGASSLTWVPALTGRYVVRLSTPPTALFANGISPSYSWNVR